MVAQGFTVDLNKPLVFQVNTINDFCFHVVGGVHVSSSHLKKPLRKKIGPRNVPSWNITLISVAMALQAVLVGHLGEDYQEWVHQPIVCKEGPRFFQSDFWEFLTKNEWWVIPLIWLPVVCWAISISARMGHTHLQIALLVVIGIFIWTLMEYSLHRFLFHIKTKTYWGNTLHYLLHGCHHKHPMDGLRLVFPPAATAILCVPFWNLIRLVATASTTPALFGGFLLGYVMYDITHYYLHHGQPMSEIPRNLKFWNLIRLVATPSTTPALFGGGLLGYVMYDVTHYYLHHGQPVSKIPRNLKKYHLNHHFRIQNKGFGITSSLWDRAFGTLPLTKAAEKSK